MPKPTHIQIRQLTPDNVAQFEAMMTMFGEACEEVEMYCSHRPSHRYIQDRLADDTFIAIAALDQKQIVGGLAAYELKKFEQARSEIYIYDLAVAESHRRQGIATAMIQELQQIGSQRGAYVIFVQAEYQDPPAIALYEKLGTREEVLHFDIDIPKAAGHEDS